MFCPKCGNQLPEDAVFCNECGNLINRPAAGATTTAAAENNAACTTAAGNQNETGPVNVGTYTSNAYATPISTTGLLDRLIPDGLPASANDLLSSKGFQQVSKPLALVLAALLALAFFVPAAKMGALGFSISFSVKDATFGLDYLKSLTGTNGAEPAYIVALLAPIAALVGTLLLKQNRVIWVVNLVVGALLFGGAMFEIISVQNSSYSSYITLGAGAWLYVILGLGLAVLSGFMLYKSAKK